MMSPKKLLKMARKWQAEAGISKIRITLSRINASLVDDDASSVANKGHFVVYTADKARFVIPLMYLNSNVFRELFKMSEDEFGLPTDGPILLPCDALFMKYIVEIFQRGITKEVEKALLISLASSHCSLSSFHQGQLGSQSLICGY